MKIFSRSKQTNKEWTDHDGIWYIPQFGRLRQGDYECKRNLISKKKGKREDRKEHGVGRQTRPVRRLSSRACCAVGLGSDPPHPHKKPMPVIPVLWRQRQEHPWDSPASQLNGQFQIRWVTLAQKLRQRGIEKDTNINLWPTHTCKHTHTQTHTYPTYTHKHVHTYTAYAQNKNFRW